MNKQISLFLATILAIGFFGCSGTRTSASRSPVQLEQAWATEPVLKTPESVLHDQSRNLLYVSNINKINRESRDGDGFISRLSPEGRVQDLYWVTGLNDPKGMGLHNNVLYVADLNQIVSIATQTGSILARYDVPGAKFLNDITVDASGTVYASDSDMRKIFQLRNGQVSEWLGTMTEERPNGLLMENNRLISADFNSGNIRFINPQTKAYTDWANGIVGADGIVSDGKGGYFISSWHGEVYYVNEKGEKWNVVNTREQKINAADIEYLQRDNLLLVPTFNDNRVVAYEVRRQAVSQR